MTILYLACLLATQAKQEAKLPVTNLKTGLQIPSHNPEVELRLVAKNQGNSIRVTVSFINWTDDNVRVPPLNPWRVWFEFRGVKQTAHDPSRGRILQWAEGVTYGFPKMYSESDLVTLLPAHTLSVILDLPPVKHKQSERVYVQCSTDDQIGDGDGNEIRRIQYTSKWVRIRA